MCFRKQRTGDEFENFRRLGSSTRSLSLNEEAQGGTNPASPKRPFSTFPLRDSRLLFGSIFLGPEDFPGATKHREAAGTSSPARITAYELAPTRSSDSTIREEEMKRVLLPYAFGLLRLRAPFGPAVILLSSYSAIAPPGK